MNPRLGRNLRLWLLLLLVWSLPGLLTATFNAVLFPQVLRQGALLYFSALTSYWLVWALLSPAVIVMARRFPIERSRLVSSVAPHLVAALACIVAYAAWYALFAKILTSPPERPEAFWTLLRGNIGARMATGTVLYAGIIGITIAFDERVARRERELHAAQLEAALGRAQLQALQMQLQPHFLFNTLHAISMLVQENPSAATRTIAQLGDLLRRTLALSDVPELSLREELELLQQYVDIEQTRFGDHLTVTIDVPDTLLAAPVPSLLLQPLVENAVRHGVQPRVEPGHVTVRARSGDQCLTLEVRDDGPGFVGTQTRDAGVGLATTRERLSVLYGRAASLTCTDAPDGGAIVVVTIPLRDV